MRLLTGNLNHSRTSVRAGQHEILETLKPDIAVLTEAGRPVDLEHRDHNIVVSDPRRNDGESWVVIRGRTVTACDFTIPYERMAAAATAKIDGIDLLIYGSVLPWRAAASHAPDVFQLPESGVPTAAIYGAWLTAQIRDIWRLRRQYPDHQFLWLGDFNVPVSPPFEYHLRAGSMMTVDALKGLNLRVYNADAEHLLPGLHTIDLICGPNDLVVARSESVDCTSSELALSDHRLYFTDVERS
jgi:hypothetical protein